MYNLNSFPVYTALFILAIIEFIRYFVQAHFVKKISTSQKKVEVAFVEQIAKIQEEVKAEFAKQNETIKAELSFSNQHKLNLMAIEREAIFDFNKSYGAFYQLLSDFTFVFNNDQTSFNSKDFEDRISQIKNVRNTYVIASNHLSLFYNNDTEFLNKREKLNYNIIVYSNILQEKLRTFTEIDLDLNLNNTGKVSDFQLIDKINISNKIFFKENIDSYREIKISYTDIIEYLSDKFKS